MDIEAIVKKHTLNGFATDGMMRTALTELSETHAIELRAYEATVQNQAERIRQLEAELTMSATYVDYKNVMELVLCYGQEKQSFGATNDVERGIGACDILAKIRAMLAAAPQQKQLCPKCGGSGEHALANTGVTEDDNCRACAGSGYVPQQKKEGEDREDA